MNPIYVLCEGKTEQNFVNQILGEYLYNKYQIERIYGIMANTSKNAKGGSLSYSRYKNEVQDLLKKRGKCHNNFSDRLLQITDGFS